MLKRAFNISVIGMIAIVSTLLGATPAAAADPWTVTPGGPVSIAGGPLTISDASGTTLYRCSTWSTDGQFRAGTGLPGVGIGTIVQSYFSFGGCTGQLSISVQPNWPVNASSYRSDWNWTFGTINARIAIFGPQCFGGISTPVSFIYENDIGVLWSNVLRPVTSNANGCILTLGRSVISPRQTITSP